ncbi:hypothetical protein TCAL_16344, partial [Tigriopus californicus]
KREHRSRKGNSPSPRSCPPGESKMEPHLTIPNNLNVTNNKEQMVMEEQSSPLFGQKIEKGSLKIKGSYSPGWSAVHSKRWRDDSDENTIESESDEGVEVIDCTAWTKCVGNFCFNENRVKNKKKDDKIIEK